MAATEGIYFLFRVQLDPQRASPAGVTFKYPFNSPSQSSPAEPLWSSANATSAASATGGDAL